MPVPEPLRTVLVNTFNVNRFWTRWEEGVHSYVTRLPDKGSQFRQQLADAIVKKTISPDEYQNLTEDRNHTTNDAVADWLRELWHKLYGEEFDPEDFA